MIKTSAKFSMSEILPRSCGVQIDTAGNVDTIFELNIPFGYDRNQRKN